MLNSDRAPQFLVCPRCRVAGLESLKSYSYCVNCNYGNWKTSSTETLIPDWVYEVLDIANPKNRLIPIY